MESRYVFAATREDTRDDEYIIYIPAGFKDTWLCVQERRNRAPYVSYVSKEMNDELDAHFQRKAEETKEKEEEDMEERSADLQTPPIKEE